MAEEERRDDSSDPHPPTQRVRVLDVKQSRTKDVEYDGSARVKGLMEAVEATFGVPTGRQRLICSGRMMRPSELLSSYKLQGNTIHLFPRTTATSTTEGNDDLPSGLTVRRPLLGESESSSDDALARLALFHTVDEVDDDVERGVLSLGQTTLEPTLTDLGSPREFLWGFVMGFLLGFIMLLYLWERSASHRQKMGILAGATAQLLVKYIHAGLLAANAPPGTN